MKSENRLIAKVVRPVGLKGEVKAKCLLRNSALYRKLQYVIIDNREYVVAKASSIPDFVTFKLEGIDDRDGAELFRNKEIYADHAQSLLLLEGDYFIDDLIGMKLLKEDKCLGTVIDIYTFSPYNDTIQLENDAGERINFPNIKGVITGLDFEKGEITVDPIRFDEVAIYED